MKRFLLIALLFLLSPFAAKGTIVINEIAWMGTENSANDEWIELYSDQQVNLTGWILEAADETPFINLEGTISANSYFLLERTDDNSVPNITANQIYIGALENSGEYLKLRDSSNNIIDEVNCSDGWMAGNNLTKQTMERTASSWQTSLNSGGTPKRQNSKGQKPQEPEKESNQTAESANLPNNRANKSSIVNTENNIAVFISEFLPNPDGKDAEEEWIELYNDSNQIIDISGWQLDDEEGGSRPFVFPEKTVIAPRSYLVFSCQITGIALNNDGDKVRLLLPQGTLFQEITYTKAPEGRSSSRASESFVWTTPTPGLPNKSEIAPSLSTKSSNQKNKDPVKNKQEIPQHKSSKQIQQNYYNLANLEKSAENKNKLILVIITITVIVLIIGIAIIKLKKKC